MDFFIPTANIGIEIQGPYHYSDSKQIAHDALKRNLAEQANIKLIELTVFQTSPSRLYKKLQPLAPKLFRPFERKRPEWEALQRRYQKYKRDILVKYGKTVNGHSLFTVPKPGIVAPHSTPAPHAPISITIPQLFPGYVQFKGVTGDLITAEIVSQKSSQLLVRPIGGIVKLSINYTRITAHSNCISSLKR